MGIIKDKFKEKSDIVAGEIKALLKEHGNKKIGEVTLSQIYQGMRGITGVGFRNFITRCPRRNTFSRVYYSRVATKITKGAKWIRAIT